MARRRQAAIVACALAVAPVYAHADDAAIAVAVSGRFTQNDAGAEFAFDLSRSVTVHAYALDEPRRLVLDLPEVNFRVDPAIGRLGAGNDAGPVKAFRFGLVTAGRSRIVIDLQRPACPSLIESKPVAEGASASRLRIRLVLCDAAAFAALRGAQATANAEAPAPAPAQPVIVLDPGHGGVDGGAHGIGGVAEKAVVWDFCAELKRKLEATGRYKILLTRDGDRYVDLDDRVAFGRDSNAALFISVHADTLTDGAASVSGSTVYTASERASDAEAARIAARENAADGDGKAGHNPGDAPGVSDILFDLKRRETRAYAHIFSRGLAQSLGGVTRLNHNPERSASFVVLKAPEFPSVLVELGYLSNPQDLRALTSPEWRERTAAAMVRAVDRFFAAPGTGVAVNDPGVALAPREAPNR